MPLRSPVAPGGPCSRGVCGPGELQEALPPDGLDVGAGGVQGGHLDLVVQLLRIVVVVVLWAGQRGSQKFRQRFKIL